MVATGHSTASWCALRAAATTPSALCDASAKCDPSRKRRGWLHAQPWPWLLRPPLYSPARQRGEWWLRAIRLRVGALCVPPPPHHPRCAMLRPSVTRAGRGGGGCMLSHGHGFFGLPSTRQHASEVNGGYGPFDCELVRFACRRHH